MKTNKLVIHAGGIFPNPTLNREGAAKVDTQPGTIGVFTDGKFTASVDGEESRILYVANMDYLLCKNASEVIKAGDVVVGIHPISGMFFNVLAAAGNYKEGDPLSIVNGAVAPVTKSKGEDEEESKEVQSSFYAKETTNIAAGELLRVVFK